MPDYYFLQTLVPIEPIVSEEKIFFKVLAKGKQEFPIVTFFLLDQDKMTSFLHSLVLIIQIIFEEMIKM
jgi:hypothetical protein